MMSDNRRRVGAVVAPVSEHANTRNEVLSAEAKMARGIKILYLFAKKHNLLKYDAQGIATVELSANQCTNVAKYFPGGLTKGINIHFHREDFIPYPPIRYMIQQKIKSFCDMARDLYQLDCKALMVRMNNEILEGLENIKKKASNNGNKPIDMKIFHKEAQALMKKLVRVAMKRLCDEYYKKLKKNDKLSVFTQDEFFYKPLMDNFLDHLHEESVHYRSNERDILTFNEKTKIFSYDEGSRVTAHDKGYKPGCPNLTLACEGSYATSSTSHKPVFQTNTSYIKHAQLGLTVKYKKTEEEQVMETCRQIREIMERMAYLRLHGRSIADRKKPLTIDWVYQVLTTNVNEGSLYGCVAKAMKLMNGVQFKLPGGPFVTLNTSVMNAGINEWGNWNFFRKSDTQRRENRRAYIQCTDALKDFVPKTDALPNPNGFAAKVKILRDALVPGTGDRKVTAALKEYKRLQEKIAKNAKQFQIVLTEQDAHKKLNPKERAQYELSMEDNAELIKFHMEESERLYDLLRHQTYIIENHRLEQWEKNKNKFKHYIHEIEKLVFQNRNELDEKLRDPHTGMATQQQLLGIAALIYKSYADDLYYSGKYRKPEQAAIFNAYLLSYQKIVGMMGSVGCKSCNDRGFVVRLLLSAMAGHPFVDDASIPKAKQLGFNLLPEPCHSMKTNDHVMQGTLVEHRCSENIMSHAGVYSCINDTAGAPPKIAQKKFSVLQGVEGVRDSGYMYDYRRMAAHKMEMGKFKDAIALTPLISLAASPTLFGARDGARPGSSDSKSPQINARKPKKSL